MVAEPIGMSRGLLMMWENKEVVELINYSKRHSLSMLASHT